MTDNLNEPKKEDLIVDRYEGAEHHQLIEKKDKCPHCYLVAFKCIMVLLVIPALIVASTLIWIVWLILLPTTIFCPCGDLCAAVVKFLWKLLSKIPVHIMDWVCGKQGYDQAYQNKIVRKRRHKRSKHPRKLKTYNTMETQTESLATSNFDDQPDLVQDDPKPEHMERENFEVDLLVDTGGAENNVHGQGPPFGDLGPLVEEPLDKDDDLLYIE